MAGGSQWRSVLSERDSSASCMSRNCPIPNASGSRLGKFGVSKQPWACIFWNPALLLTGTVFQAQMSYLEPEAGEAGGWASAGCPPKGRSILGPLVPHPCPERLVQVAGSAQLRGTRDPRDPQVHSKCNNSWKAGAPLEENKEPGIGTDAFHLTRQLLSGCRGNRRTKEADPSRPQGACSITRNSSTDPLVHRGPPTTPPDHQQP
eukprot:bmy_15844T0